MKEILAWVTPIALLVIGWLLQPVIRGVPEIEKKQEVQNVQMQQFQKQLEEQKIINEKAAASQEQVKDKLEDLEDQVKDVERAIKK